jgi:hypothetical protein
MSYVPNITLRHRLQAVEFVSKVSAHLGTCSASVSVQKADDDELTALPEMDLISEPRFAEVGALSCAR